MFLQKVYINMDIPMLCLWMILSNRLCHTVCTNSDIHKFMYNEFGYNIYITTN